MDKLGDDGNLDKAEIWSYASGRTASLKYRENTVYGNVIVTATYYMGMKIVKYPSKEVVWSGGKAVVGDNPHSVEILPSGNILSAASSGSSVRIFNNANVLKNKDALKYQEYTLSGAHGLLYDPTNNYVWALGSRDLVAYQVIDNKDGTESLKKVDGFGGTLPMPAAGHDLSADLTNPRYLWITNVRGVVRYDKLENKFELTFPNSDKLSVAGLKGYGNNRNNNFVWCFPNGGKGCEWENKSYASWSTDTIYFAASDGAGGFKIKSGKSPKSAFYKVRIFDGRYQ